VAVADGGAQGGAHHAAGARGGLHAAADHAGHGQVEALAQPGFAADHVGIGHEEVLEGEVERVHAAVADGGDGAAGEVPPRSCRCTKSWPSNEGFSTSSRLRPLWPKRAVGVGARDHHQHAGLAGEGAPGLGAVQQPAAVDMRAAQREAGDVGAVVRFGDRDGAQRVAGRQPRQPVRLLLLGAARHQRARSGSRAA
jgi:hypothetical protein